MNRITRGVMVSMILLMVSEATGQPVGSTAVTTGSHLRVRQGPSLSAGIITEIDKGVSGEVIDAPAGIDWVKVRIPSANAEGWVHRDYLEFPGMAAKPPTSDERASNEPAAKTVPYVFAEVSNLDGQLFVHGHFKEGLPVLLLDERQIQVWRGKTIAQGMFENPATGIFAITHIGLEEGERLATAPVLAVVGYPEGYAPVRPRAVTDREELHRLDVVAHKLSKDLVQIEVQTLGARLARASSFELGNGIAHLLEYEHPYGGSYDLFAEHSYVVVHGKQSWHVFARCGTAPEVFRLNGRYFVTGIDKCCECGGRTKYVKELAEGGVSYTNSDWGS